MPNQFERTYLSNLSFTSFGGVERAKLGNGRWESAQFDAKRLQTRQIGLGASSGDTSLLKIEYDFGTTDNNGSLRQQKITVPGASNQIIQNYTYDMLNRLQSATETVNSQTSWKQTFLFDRFGNRRFDANNTTTLPANNGVYNPQIDAQTNKFLVAEGYNYDSEGNLTNNPESQLFTYDAENRQTQVTNTASQTSASYFYDGNGKRVKKVVGQEETIFVYDAFGKLVAEYSNVIDSRPKATSYLTTDDLGSPRIVTNQMGQVVSRHDYHPFGEEVMANVGGRTIAQGYAGNDGVRNQFTGYERDAESALDYAQARYFSSKHGRFTSVDPLAASANIKNPQTFNRYSYGLNSPYKFTDPLGLAPCGNGNPNGGNAGRECTQADDLENAADGCDPKKNPCPVPKPIAIDVGINEDGAVTVEIGDFVSVPAKVKGKSIWQHIKGFFSDLFDTGTGTPTIPTPTAPSPDAPTSGGPDSASGGSSGGVEILVGVTFALAQKYIDELLNGKQLEDGHIYRNNGQNPGNLAPRPVIDVRGLSASLDEPPSNQEYIKLNVSKLRNAGLLVINDHGRHVAIVPRTGRELVEWMAAKATGAGLNHKYTRAVKESIVRYNRGQK